MEFFEKYEVRELVSHRHSCIVYAQGKMADLDSRLSSVSQDKATLKEKIAVLKANAEKLNPNKKVTTTETIR